MAQRIEFESIIPKEEATLAKSGEQFPRIKAFFDCADYIVERTKRLTGNSKDLTLRLALFLLVIKDLILFLWK